ncbi:uncharacterized protein LOC125698769 [Lagopus muta]|uniref:uncharacterized protein LOC125698769 n=1 Tax=Lagopus muta TaxID=64668 RepID=UPI00209D75C3|nr:uncharacterized protein LOC125698769 [Lagopus muta]
MAKVILYSSGSGCSSHSLPSLTDNQRGRTAMPTCLLELGTGAVMPVIAVTPVAGSRQREWGELPQQPSGARRGIAASPQAGRAQTGHQSCAGRSLAQLTLSSRPQPICFPRPWQLLLCSSCAAQGTHRCCSNLSHSTTSWECSACAGEGTGKRQTAACSWAGARRGFAQIPFTLEEWDPVPPQGWRSVLLTFLSPLTASSTNLDTAGPNTISQQGLGPSQGPIGQDNSSSGTTNQPDHDSQVPELLSRQTRRARTRSRSPLYHRAADNNRQPQRRRRSRSRRRGPARGRSRSRLPRGAQNINHRPH